MRYFNEFPVIDYNLTGVNGNSKKVTDIFRRVKVRSKIANNLSLPFIPIRKKGKLGLLNLLVPKKILANLIFSEAIYPNTFLIGIINLESLWVEKKTSGLDKYKPPLSCVTTWVTSLVKNLPLSQFLK